ncbi:MAG: TetR/AcrR family transcriptional regulator [Treponema sp.]|nr:TetR/AcrR family transcriptional regulator [Treponema sp.]
MANEGTIERGDVAPAEGGRAEGGRAEGARAEGARDRILSAAIDLIEREGTDKATTRVIAAAAGVNVAAINYYFRSKDALVEAALAVSWSNAMEDLEGFLRREPWDPRGTLLSIAGFLIEGATVYPRLTRANLFNSGGHPIGPVAKGLATVVESLAGRLCDHFARPLDEAARDRVHAFLSATVFPILVPFSPDRLAGTEARARYASAIADDLLAYFMRKG